MSEGKLKIDMIDYIDKMGREFPEELDGDTKYPWTEKLFAVDKNSAVLSTESANTFHTHTMKIMYLAKRTRPDVLPAVIFSIIESKNIYFTRLEKVNKNDEFYFEDEG